MANIGRSEFVMYRVRCEAPAPDSVRASTVDGKCNHILGDIPGPLRHVTCAAKAPREPGIRIWLMCPRKDCRSWNCFELILPAGLPVPRVPRDADA